MNEGGQICQVSNSPFLRAEKSAACGMKNGKSGFFSVMDIIQVLIQQQIFQSARKNWNKLKKGLSMSTVYLLRHCEYDNPRHILPGRLPVALSANGKKQAEKLRDFFASQKIEKIYSSEVLRCRQTSEIISGGKIPIEFDTRLLEVMTSYQGYWVENYDLYYTMRPTLGGETNKDVQDRIVDFWKKTKFKKEKNYIVCSHGDPLYFLNQYLNKIPLEKEGDFNCRSSFLPIGGYYSMHK